MMLSSSCFNRCWWANEIFGDIFQIEYSEDPDIIFISGRGTKQVGKVNSRTNKVIWTYPVRASGISYHPGIKRLICAADEEEKLIELDSETGRLIREIKETNLGPIGKVWDICYCSNDSMPKPFSVYDTHYRDDPDLVAFADWKNHVAGILRLSKTTFEFCFGEYGKKGDDLRHLNCPRDVAVHGSYPLVWISDWENDRLLYVDTTNNTVKYIWLCPSPSSVRYMLNSPASTCTAVNAVVSTEFRYQPLTLVLSDFQGEGLRDYTSLIGSIPIATNVATFNPHNPQLISLNQWNSVFEINWVESSNTLRYLRRFSKHCVTNCILADHGEWTSRPIVGLINDRMQIKIYASGNLKAYIESPEPKYRLLAVPPDFKWKTVDMFNCQKRKFSNYVADPPLDVFRVKVRNLGKECSFSLYLEGY